MAWRLSTDNIDWELLQSKLMRPLVPAFEQLLNQYKLPKKTHDEAPRVMILGVPGTGKGTIIEKLKENDYELIVHNTGDVMLDLARDLYGINNRDEIRHKLRLRQQDDLQRRAVQIISERCKELGGVYLFDCHATTLTERGFLLGLDPQNFYNYAPDAIVYLRADPSEILKRREEDTSRDRETNLEDIILHNKFDLEVLKVISKVTGVPVYIIWTNTKEDIPIAAISLKEIIEHARPLQIFDIDDSYYLRGNKIQTSEYLLSCFLQNTKAHIHPIVQAGLNVQEVAQNWSKSTGRPVYVINNMEGGSVFNWSMDNWSSQFESWEQAEKFSDEIKNSNCWTKGLAYLKKSRHGNNYKSTLFLEKAKAFRDAAVLQVATKYLKQNYISAFMYHITGTRISSDNKEVYYPKHIIYRVGAVLEQLTINVLIADTCRLGRVRAFSKYDNDVLSYFKRSPLETNARTLKDDYLLLNSTITYDPDPSNKWWDGIPEVIYPVCQVTCSTNLGRIKLQDYLRITVGRESGQWDRRKGWENKMNEELRFELK